MQLRSLLELLDRLHLWGLLKLARQMFYQTCTINTRRCATLPRALYATHLFAMRNRRVSRHRTCSSYHTTSSFI